MKTGLVLEGGAMRGMYTAGALDVLLENDINFDGIIGTSAGAVFGVNFLSRQDGRVIRYNCRFNGDRNYMGIKPLLKSGDFFNTEYAYYKVPNELDIFDDEAYQKSGVPFYATVTDVKTGKPEYLKVESVLRDMEMLRASASMPFISKPVIIGEYAKLADTILSKPTEEWEDSDLGRMLFMLESMTHMDTDLLLAEYVLPRAIVKRQHLGANHPDIQCLVKLIYENQNSLILGIDMEGILTEQQFARFYSSSYLSGDVAKLKTHDFSEEDCYFIAEAVSIFGGYENHDALIEAEHQYGR